MKILFFIGSLRSGGKERRLVELLSYLKNKGGYEIKLILAYNEIAYHKINALDIDIIDLQKKQGKKSFGVFYQFYRICKDFRPDIIHTWGSMQTFYALPSKILLNIPLVNSQIADSIGTKNMPLFVKFTNLVNFKFSNVICSNSFSGLKAYQQEKDQRAVVVYNGLDENRFVNLENENKIRKKYGISTRYAVVMTASYSYLKDWCRFVDVAIDVVKRREDITFIGVGAILNQQMYDELQLKVKEFANIQLQGRCNEIEDLVNACDLGVLFSNKKHGEGVSNSILEYLALGKAVVVDKTGGTPEFIEEGENGFFSADKNNKEVADLIIRLIDDEHLREQVGLCGRKTIIEKFTLNRMGEGFEKIYVSLK